MATYQKRGDRWRAIIRKSGHRPVSKSFRTKTAARRWARETEDGIESRQFSDPRDIENITIGDLIDRYIKEFDPKPTKKGSLNIIKAGLARIKHPARSFEQIFKHADIAGPDNVILNDSEVAVVLAGGGKPVSAGTIANRRWKGTFNAPYQHGSDRHVEYRLSDVLAEKDRRIKRRA